MSADQSSNVGSRWLYIIKLFFFVACISSYLPVSLTGLPIVPRFMPFISVEILHASAHASSEGEKGTEKPPSDIKKREEVLKQTGVVYYDMAMTYATNQKVKDMKKAMMWFQRAADLGHVDAMFNLGVGYANGLGVPVDFDQAMKWYTKAAEHGSADAMYNIGASYDKGHGTAQNKKLAIEWYTKAAQLNQPNAAYNLGILYWKGQGVLRDGNTAMTWFSKAAGLGHAGAMYNLGVACATGAFQSRDEVKAVDWFRKSAELGDADSMAALSRMYVNGQGGLTKNFVEAYVWAKLGAMNGNSAAQSASKKIKRYLTEAECNRADVLIHTWIINHPHRKQNKHSP